MSRCFPFPPPGYEKKARSNDTDLLIKEKHNEKRHKKDKKDKEKREDKEKKDKHRSKEKHKDNKDRKEKHKDKDKKSSTEKNQISNEKRIERQPVLSNTLQSDVVPDSKYVQDLARRIMDEDVTSGNQMVQRIFANEHRRTELRGTAVERSAHPQSSEKERGQIVQKVVATNHRRGDLWGVAADSGCGHQASERERAKNKNEDSKKFNGQRNHVDRRSLEEPVGHSLSHPEQERFGEFAKMEGAEGKEKSKHKASDGGKGEKLEVGGQESKKSKDKDRVKEKKKEEKVKEMKETNHEPPKLKGNAPKLKESSKHPLDFRITPPSDPSKLRNISPDPGGILGKRKEPEVNGSILGNGIQPHKLSKPLVFSHTVVENGRKPEPCMPLLLEKPGPSNNHKVDIKQQKVNGLILTQPPLSSTKPLATKVQPPSKNSEPSAKPPHPDTKYLIQILSVPKMEELSDSLDQDWLFSNSHEDSKKFKKSSPGIDGARQVWAEAFQIKSADIAALPFVLPY